MSPGDDPGGDARRPARPLAAIVRSEALRADAEERVRPDPARVAAGWDRRFVIEAARAADLVKLYEDVGFEVAVDPVSPGQLQDECLDCRLVARLGFAQVYVRRRR